MNPPFGEFSKQWKGEARVVYPSSYSDILSAFIERSLYQLLANGRLGAITSRTCFFLTSFTDWRTKVLLKDSAIRVIADLGQGVMDEAMVEAAAYVLERTTPTATTTVFRAIADDDRQCAVRACLDAFREGKAEPRLFLADQEAFHLLPDSPFVYWIDGQTVQQFSLPHRFEPDIGSVRQGLATGDDPRFVRAIWEVAPEDTQFCYYPTNGDNFCRFEDPIVQAYLHRRCKGTPRWAFYVKAGASQPWYSPITLKVNWNQDGAELLNFTDEKGKLRSRPQSVLFYYRPGMSWTLRAVRFYPYIIPGNCIPSVSRYMAFPEYGKEVEALGLSASWLASAFLRFYAEFWQRPKFLVENVKMLPWPESRQRRYGFLNLPFRGKSSNAVLPTRTTSRFRSFCFLLRFMICRKDGRHLHSIPTAYWACRASDWLPRISDSHPSSQQLPNVICLKRSLTRNVAERAWISKKLRRTKIPTSSWTVRQKELKRNGSHTPLGVSLVAGTSASPLIQHLHRNCPTHSTRCRSVRPEPW